MFQKVLVAADFESANSSVQKSLILLNIAEKNMVYSEDDALGLLQESFRAENPFDLLITDLSFEDNPLKQNLQAARELISQARNLLPNLKVFVFSAEKRPQIIKKLFIDLQINGYVAKGRADVKELRTAIEIIADNQTYISTENLIKARKADPVELSSIEFSIIKLLSEGVFQKNMSEVLKEKKIKPNSLSSIEKTLNYLKETFSAKSNEHLIAICKDLGVL